MLPESLEKEYQAILATFDPLRSDWNKYADQIIPEDPVFAKQIISFLISVVSYAKDHFENIDVPAYQKFLAFFDMDFYYGPRGDDRNYLDFDESVDGTPFTELTWPLRDEDVLMTKEDLTNLKKQYEAVLELF
ncbi:MAG: hypothetical protein H6502_02960 [Candidatus Woesearchaeota archaeon]|nr:MAG: hypothetical protein H6502_02960 [Candidatus Woesearchaeota archaeon]